MTVNTVPLSHAVLLTADPQVSIAFYLVKP